MISTKDLRAIARARLRDTEVLLAAKRFDGAFYNSPCPTVINRAEPYTGPAVTDRPEGPPLTRAAETIRLLLFDLRPL
jgi:hypothetical protein